MVTYCWVHAGAFSLPFGFTLHKHYTVRSVTRRDGGLLELEDERKKTTLHLGYSLMCLPKEMAREAEMQKRGCFHMEKKKSL